jgi:hypothetical protein
MPLRCRRCGWVFALVLSLAAAWLLASSYRFWRVVLAGAVPEELAAAGVRVRGRERRQEVAKASEGGRSLWVFHVSVPLFDVKGSDGRLLDLLSIARERAAVTYFAQSVERLQRADHTRVLNETITSR